MVDIILKLYMENAYKPEEFRKAIKPFLKHLAPAMTHRMATRKILDTLKIVKFENDELQAHEYITGKFIRDYFKELGYSSI